MKVNERELGQLVVMETLSGQSNCEDSSWPFFPLSFPFLFFPSTTTGGCTGEEGVGEWSEACAKEGARIFAELAPRFRA